MRFDLSEEQQQLRDSLKRLVERTYGFEKRQQILESPSGHSREVWHQLAELGVLAIGMPEPFGTGGTAIDNANEMFCWGQGPHGELGDGGHAANLPTLVGPRAR